MNIIEAVKSGLPFKRIVHKAWRSGMENESMYSFSCEEILADDWEIKERIVTVEIRACGDCPHFRDWDSQYCARWHHDLTIKDKYEIPNWCPLLEKNK